MFAASGILWQYSQGRAGPRLLCFRRRFLATVSGGVTKWELAGEVCVHPSGAQNAGGRDRISVTGTRRHAGASGALAPRRSGVPPEALGCTKYLGVPSPHSYTKE